ncbi:unnamed protein product [Eruca vesicaria subsp. sativa]|uniref:Uncharacterized protein n=1 Tax=Eruca vesicaria subsp. sativa TaxID=29727 RepID=A0ABC8JZ37_ERUVS|nr:unnamed protein product [Eruca vesicaria subsp. sativa]
MTEFFHPLLNCFMIIIVVNAHGGTAVAVLAIAAASLVAVKMTGNVAILLIQRIRHALIGRAMDDQDMRKILHFLMNDSVVYALNDCKSEVIDPESFRFKAEIGEEVVTALGSEVIRLEKQIRELVPGI